MTWKDIKLVTLQKMFSAEGDSPIGDEATTDYIAAMPGAANEALYRIAVTCRGITRTIEIDCINETGYTMYDVKSICDNFYKIMEPIYVKQNGRYSVLYDFDIIDESNIVLPAGAAYKISCKVYPEKITSKTLDSHEIELHPEEAAIVPLYIASQLYKDDDVGQAVQMLNEFESRLEELAYLSSKLESISDKSGHFKSKNGWC